MSDSSGAVVGLGLIGLFAIGGMCLVFAVSNPNQKTDIEIMRSRVEGTLMSGDYTYIVDGVELDTIDEITLSNLYKYNVTMDTEGKKVVLTTRPVRRSSTMYIPIYR